MHDHLSRIKDSRDTVTKPSDYADDFKFIGIKNSSIIGFKDGTPYASLIGFNAWSDSSGIGSVEIAVLASGEIYMRKQAYNDKTDSFGDWKQIITSVDVVDNLTSTSTTKPLSANQGKVLNDRIDNEAILRKTTVIDEFVDWNTITTPGIYKVQTKGHFGDPETYHAPNELYADIYQYGNLIVLSSINDLEYRTIQIYIPHLLSDPVYRVKKENGCALWRSLTEYRILKSSTDLTAGLSDLGNGKLYFVYE